MSSDPGERPDAGADSQDEQFVVPVPVRAEALPAAGPRAGTDPAATQEVPVSEPTRELPSLPAPPAASVDAPARTTPWAAPSADRTPAGSAWPPPAGPDVTGPPPVPHNPYAGQPIWPPGASPVRDSPADQPGAGPAAGPDDVDPLLAQIGVALFWIAVGWWVFFGVRLIGWFTRYGVTDTMVIHTIDLGAEETVLAAVLSVLAALLLLFGRGRNGRTPLGYASAALAAATVLVAVWRLIP
jgi:hypothetical protein